MGANKNWFERVLKRLPMMQPGTLVVTSAGIGVFMGNWEGSDRIFGARRGDRLLLEPYLTWDSDW